MSAILLCVYVLTGIFHEVTAILFKEQYRKIAKISLMPILIIYYFFTVSDLLILVIIAIIFSWAGDILLIRKEEPKFFKLGLVAFLLSHIFYIIALIVISPAVNFPVLYISIGAALILNVLLPVIIKPPKEMRIPVIIYGTIILTMSICALQYLLSNITISSIMLFAGSIVFVFSDSLMSYLAFREKPKYFNAITMLPYIIAQGMIVFGFATA